LNTRTVRDGGNRKESDTEEEPGYYYDMRKYRVILKPDENGGFLAECPDLPGCLSEGSTRAEAKRNIADAIQGYLESLKKHGEPVPPSRYEETTVTVKG
jgi:predicted RNase H-like HicB family nuclease